MPEGDTIRKAAALLAPLLLGQTISRAASRWPSASFGLQGRQVVEIEPIGKNLWVVLDDGNALRIHLGMHGKWRFLPPGSRTPGSLGYVSLLLELESGTVVCTAAPTVERVPAEGPPVHPVLGALGPDVLGDSFDVEAVLPRIALSPVRTVAAVLLDQQVACGIGNVYKCGDPVPAGTRYPFDPPSAVDREEWIAMYALGRELMQRNLGPGPRITTPAGMASRTWVYGRAGRRASVRRVDRAPTRRRRPAASHLVVSAVSDAGGLKVSPRSSRERATMAAGGDPCSYGCSEPRLERRP